jgi:hypothetical protein
MQSIPTWVAEATEFLASAIAAKLQQKPATYNSRTNLPPGVSRRTFAARCKDIPEAVKTGAVWVCPEAAWLAHHASKVEPQALDAYEAAVRKAGGK